MAGVAEPMLATKQNSLKRQIYYEHPSNFTMRLPPEILSMVFEEDSVNHWLDYRHKRLLLGPTASIPHAWVRILHVCRRWRSIAFSTPRLWTRIIPTSLDFVECAIAHSGSLPLDIDCLCPDDVDMSDTAMQLGILKELHRVRSIGLLVTAEMLDLLQSTRVPMDALPFLATLIVYFSLDESATTLHPFSGAALPKLLTLCVQYGSFPSIQSLSRPTLTCLFILDPIPFSFAQMLDLFASLPSLRDVRLRNVVSTSFLEDLPDDTLPQVSRTISLPHLCQLGLYESSEGRASAYLLAHLVLPPGAHIDLVAGRASALSHRFSALQLSVPRALSFGPAPLRPQSIELLSCGSEVNIRLWSSVQEWHYKSPEARESITMEDPALVVILASHESHSVPTIDKLFDLINLEDVRTLSLTGSFTHKISVWHLSAMKMLDTLYLRGPVYPHPIVDAFSGPLPQYGIGPEDWLFPRLRSLEVADVLWRIENQPDSELTHLTESLKHRTRYGLQLKLLTITHPGNLYLTDVAGIDDLEVAERSVVDPHGYSHSFSQNTDEDDGIQREQNDAAEDAVDGTGDVAGADGDQ